MAKKIIGGVGSLLGLKKKKKAAAETPATPAAAQSRWTPIIKQLGAPAGGMGDMAAIIARARSARSAGSTILSDKLGS